MGFSKEEVMPTDRKIVIILVLFMLGCDGKNHAVFVEQKPVCKCTQREQDTNTCPDLEGEMDRFTVGCGKAKDANR